MTWEASHFAKLARFFPLYISAAATILSLIDVILQAKKLMSEKKEHAETVHDNPFAVAKYILWVLGYLLLIYLIGFITGTVIYLFAFLYFETGFGIIKSTISVAITVLLIYIFGNFMTLYWPVGLLGRYLGW